MTATEALKAGRELDALVAERVMGWHKEPYKPPIPGVPLQDEWFDAEGNKTGFFWEGGGGDYYQPNEEWSPSTDIAAAWTVLERLQVLTRERNLWGPSLQVRAPISGQRWVVRVANDLYGGMAEPHTDDTIWQGVADTFPEAVCLCALQAVALST